MNDLDEEMRSFEPDPITPEDIDAIMNAYEMELDCTPTQAEILEAAVDKRRTRLTLAEVAEAIANASDKHLSEVLSLYCEDERLLLGGVIVDIIDDYLRGVAKFERGQS